MLSTTTDRQESTNTARYSKKRPSLPPPSPSPITEPTTNPLKESLIWRSQTPRGLDLPEQGYSKDSSQMAATPIAPNYCSSLPTHELCNAFPERSKPPHLVTVPQGQESRASRYGGAGLWPNEAYSTSGAEENKRRTKP